MPMTDHAARWPPPRGHGRERDVAAARAAIPEQALAPPYVHRVLPQLMGPGPLLFAVCPICRHRAARPRVGSPLVTTSASAPTAPLVVRTVPVDLADLPLLDLLPEQEPVSWLRRGEG